MCVYLEAFVVRPMRGEEEACVSVGSRLPPVVVLPLPHPFVYGALICSVREQVQKGGGGLGIWGGISTPGTEEGEGKECTRIEIVERRSNG